MTGGIGFSRQGSDSFKANRGLRGKRKSIGDIPGYGNSKTDRKGTANYEQLKTWKHKKEAKQKKLKVIIYTSVGLITLLVLIFFSLA